MFLKLMFGVVIVVGIALGAVFIKDYLNQTSAADQLQTQILNSGKTAQVVASQTRSVQDELADITKRSAAAESAINTQKQALPQPTNANVVVRDILSAAKQFDVSVIPLTTDDWVRQRVDKHEYSVFRANLAVSGDPDKALAFIKHLQKDLYPTLVIESLDMQKSIETAETETVQTRFVEVAPTNPDESPVLQEIQVPVPTEVSVTKLTVNVKLAIYAR